MRGGPGDAPAGRAPAPASCSSISRARSGGTEVHRSRCRIAGAEVTEVKQAAKATLRKGMLRRPGRLDPWVFLEPFTFQLTDTTLFQTAPAPGVMGPLGAP